MESVLSLLLLSPEKMLYQGEVEEVTVPGTKGPFTILPEHAPIISSLDEGNVSYKQEGKKTVLKIKNGFVEMKNNQVTVCVELNKMP